MQEVRPALADTHRAKEAAAESYKADAPSAAQSSATPADAGGLWDIASAGKQRARRLSLFPASSRINPTESPEEKQRTSVQCASSESLRLAKQPQDTRSNAGQGAWSDLPENVVERIFILVRADTLYSEAKRQSTASENQKDPAMLCGHVLARVCRMWRRAAAYIFFSDWPSAGKMTHPRHCLTLTPRVFPSLMRCFVDRERTTTCMRFELFQGERMQRASAKFLLAAELGRFGVTLHLNRSASGRGLGTVESNLLCTKYRFSLGATADGAADPLPRAEVDYRTRLQGCMRPRRMRVTLPGDNVAPSMLLARPSGRIEAAVEEVEAIPSSPGHSPNKAKGQRPFSERSEAVLGKQGRPLRLQNKTPHWNENLKCWCLNFRGRVKFASVKNFQLVDAENSDEIVMQFGKVLPDTYILDFQPASISAAQAFAVALSAFNKGLCPC